MSIRKHLLVLGALTAFAAAFWLDSPTQAAPPDVRLSLTCYPQSGLIATVDWVSNPEASGQWFDLNRLTSTGPVYEGAGPFPAEINSHAAPVQPFSVYTIRIAEYVAFSDAWATSPTFYFETGGCAPDSVPAPCAFPLCAGEFAAAPFGVAPLSSTLAASPIGNGPSVNYPAFPPTIAQYPVAGYFAPGYPAFPGGCHPSYAGACLTVGTGDFDCKRGIGSGPNIVNGTLLVVGPDTYGLDINGDGVACNAPPEIFYNSQACDDHRKNGGWWDDRGDWHDDADHDGWDDKDWDKQDWDNNHDKWGHDNGCFDDRHATWDK